MSAQYDASVALDRKLTAEETRELKISLMPIFVATGDSEASPEDINDLLDYAFAMVNNKKTVEYVIQELVGMEMDFCNAAVAEKVGAELSGFLKKAKGEAEAPQGSKIASLKVCLQSMLGSVTFRIEPIIFLAHTETILFCSSSLSTVYILRERKRVDHVGCAWCLSGRRS